MSETTLSAEERAAVLLAKSMTPLTLLMVVGRIKAEALATPAAHVPDGTGPGPGEGGS